MNELMNKWMSEGQVGAGERIKVEVNSERASEISQSVIQSGHLGQSLAKRAHHWDNKYWANVWLKVIVHQHFRQSD